MPLAEKCPKCGKYLVRKAKQIKCPACDYAVDAPDEEKDQTEE